MRRADLLEQLRADYLARIERIAEQLRPRFEAGDLRGFDDRDEEAFERAGAGPMSRTPAGQLESEVRRRLRLRDERTACLIGSLSPSAAAFKTHGGGSIEAWAVVLAVWDVLRIARERGWYKPHRSEEPSAADLRATAA